MRSKTVSRKAAGTTKSAWVLPAVLGPAAAGLIGGDPLALTEKRWTTPYEKWDAQRIAGGFGTRNPRLVTTWMPARSARTTKGPAASGRTSVG